MSEKLRVGILGATGMVGQRFISLLENHPWFEVVLVAASPRSAGKKYIDAVGERWKMTTPMPEHVKDLIVKDVNEVDAIAAEVDFVFSAVDMTKEEIRAIEEKYAKAEVPVVSNNSAHRWTPDVPMVVPEINPQHMEVIKDQKKRLGTTKGFIDAPFRAMLPCLPHGWNLSPMKPSFPPIRLFPEQERPSRTGPKWLEISFPISVARKKRARKSLFVSGVR